MNKNERAAVAAHKTECKDKHFSNQFKIVYHAFSVCSKTMMQVALETGVMRSNITRYVAVMKRQGTIKLIEKNICPVTKVTAGFYMTDQNVQPTPYVAASIDSPVMCSMPENQSPKSTIPGLHQLSLFPDYE